MFRSAEKKRCMDRCVEENKFKVAELKGTSVHYESVYPDSFTSVICKAKCTIPKRSEEHIKCQKTGWRDCRKSLEECDKLIEEKCDSIP